MTFLQFFSRSFWRMRGDESPALIATIRHNAEHMLEYEIAQAMSLAPSRLRRIAHDNDIVLRSQIEPTDYLEDAEPRGA